MKLPQGGERPFYQETICMTQLLFGPYAEQIWSRNPRISEETKPSNSTEWVDAIRYDAGGNNRFTHREKMPTLTSIRVLWSEGGTYEAVIPNGAAFAVAQRRRVYGTQDPMTVLAFG